MIDCTQIPLQRLGVGVYADNLVRELIPKLDARDRLFLLAQSDDSTLRSYGDLAPNVRIVALPSALFRNRALLGLFEQFAMPWLALGYRLDIMHSLHYTFPLIALCRKVVTVHDLTHSLMPEVHTRGRKIVMSFFSRMAARRAQAVLLDSASSREDFERLFGRGEQKRFVTPLGVSPAFFSPPPAEAIQDMLNRHQIRDRYVLFLGTIEPRKNVDRLIAAFEGIGKKYPQHVLVIAGRLGWAYEPVLAKIEASPLKPRILRLGYVSSADRLALLAACEVLVYPSIYEGFGLPVLEGMAMGRPVITSNVSSLPEVAGDGAVTIDPTRTEQLEEALDRVLSDVELRKQLGEKGRRQAAKFSWSQTAERTYEAYQAVMK